MNSEQLLSGLNAAQVEAVTTPGAPVAVLAGAGSGKTRVLTRRIAWRIVEGETDPSRVMALTFTRKAADELRHRISALGLRDRVTAGTFHGMALLQLRQRWDERGIPPPTLLDRKARLVSRLLPKGKSSSRSRTDTMDVVAEIDWARARLVGPDHYAEAAMEAGRTPPLAPELISEILVAYQQEKQRKRIVDFDDLLMLAVRDLQNDNAYAEAVRWRFRHLYVDEFQDVNPLQYELLSHWRGDRPDLFVVGDPNQAIYGWNGADPALLSRFTRREPSATVVKLEENYRSTPQVLSLAATLASGSELRPNRPDGPTPTMVAYADDEAEAAGITQRVIAAHSVAGGWSDQAVLVRTNAQLLVIEQAMRNAAIPVRLRGNSGPLTTSEVRTELKILSQPNVDLAAALEDLDGRLEQTGPSQTVAMIERRANLAAFARLVHDYVATDPTPSGPGLGAWIGTLESGDIATDDDAVDLATFHAAKGLEWSVVHVAGLEEGFVPIAYAKTGGQLAEEERLLYVAITRAMDELHLSLAASRTFTTKPVKRKPSPLLGSLAAAIKRLGTGPAQRVDWRSELAKSRQVLDEHLPDVEPQPSDALETGAMPGSTKTKTARKRHAGGAGDDQLYQALKEWRSRRARAADVPQHVVLSDQTLRAIASDGPETLGRLASLPGMRPARLQRYGEDLLRVVAESRPAL